jgi:hypothetical protein
MPAITLPRDAPRNPHHARQRVGTSTGHLGPGSARLPPVKAFNNIKPDRVEALGKPFRRRISNGGRPSLMQG